LHLAEYISLAAPGSATMIFTQRKSFIGKTPGGHEALSARPQADINISQKEKPSDNGRLKK